MVKKVKKKKPSKKNVDTKKHKNNHQMDKKKGKAVIPPLKLKLSPHKSGHGQKYLIQKSDQKSRKARTRIALPWIHSAIYTGSTILKYVLII